jgi:hypothetical protein
MKITKSLLLPVPSPPLLPVLHGLQNMTTITRDEALYQIAGAAGPEADDARAALVGRVTNWLQRHVPKETSWVMPTPVANRALSLLYWLAAEMSRGEVHLRVPYPLQCL